MATGSRVRPEIVSRRATPDPDHLTPMFCRILPHEVREGPANMAWDEALLDAVNNEPTTAVLRTYGWAEPTLSLGYFQRFAAAEADPRFQDAAIVRRPTGGGALWHELEITYALIVP